MIKIASTARCEVLDNMEKYFCNASYVDAFKHAGGDVIVAMNCESADWFAKECDALLIAGGNDMDSRFFDEPLHPLAHTYTRKIDELDYALITAFVKVKKPILGICRGLQVLNVYFGGSLLQHFDTTAHVSNEETQPMHDVHIKQSTFLSALYPETIQINSYHHQCIQRLAINMQTAATHDDGTIEAIAHHTLPIWAVQWHPEKMGNQDKIISAFIKSCLV